VTKRENIYENIDWTEKQPTGMTTLLLGEMSLAIRNKHPESRFEYNRFSVPKYVRFFIQEKRTPTFAL
jgi:hypothetical protein